PPLNGPSPESVTPKNRAVGPRDKAQPTSVGIASEAMMRGLLVVGLLAVMACDGSAGPPADGARRLSQMGLYRDIATRTIADGVAEFEPAYSLWSDGATKRRWIALPPGAQIDTSDMDHWVFPVGTKLFKEFSVAGKRVETRLIERTSTGYDMAAFAWLPD